MVRYYYATVVDGRKYALLLGPFDRLDVAKRLVPVARLIAFSLSPKSHFWSFGTACVRAEQVPAPGRLNGYAADEIARAIETTNVPEP